MAPWYRICLPVQGDTGDVGSIPGLGRSPGKEMATHSSILAWRIPWTGVPGRLQSTGSQSQTRLSMHTHARRGGGWRTAMSKIDEDSRKIQTSS